MDFGFTAEQEMLRDAARRFLASECPAAAVRAAMASPTAHDPTRWERLATLGWLGILVPEELGGGGGTFLDMAVLLEESGSALLPGPFFATAVLGATALRDAAATARARLLPAIARGEHIVAVALAAPGDPPVTSTGGRVRGRVRFVLDAHVADTVVVAADASLVAVDAAADGVTVTPLQTVDLTRRLCTVELRDAACEMLLEGRSAVTAALRRLRNAACAGLAVELVGIGQRALDMAVGYANERTQFGRPIGSFQAIKHKCVDIMVAVETARSLAYYAAWAVGEDAPDAGAAAAMAKGYCGDMAKTVTSEAIQIHGGIGFTWEHDLHLYYRRALAADAAFGAEPAHRETIMRSLGR